MITCVSSTVPSSLCDIYKVNWVPRAINIRDKNVGLKCGASLGFENCTVTLCFMTSWCRHNCVWPGLLSWCFSKPEHSLGVLCERIPELLIQLTCQRWSWKFPDFAVFGETLLLWKPSLKILKDIRTGKTFNLYFSSLISWTIDVALPRGHTRKTGSICLRG